MSFRPGKNGARRQIAQGQLAQGRSGLVTAWIKTHDRAIGTHEYVATRATRSPDLLARREAARFSL
jgi:hypothetical protein